MTFLAVAVIIASVLVVPYTCRAFFASAVRGEWTSTSSLIFLSGMVGSLPTALSNLVSPQPEVFDEFGNVRVGLTGWALQLEQAVVAASLAAALVFFVVRASREPVNGGAWIAIALVFAAASADVIQGHGADLGPRLAVLAALLLATSVAQAGRPALLGAAAVGLTYAFLGALQAAVHPADAFRVCRFDKCGPGGALYVGALSNENNLGLVLALSIPFIWLGLRGRGRVALIAYISAMVALTGSRTGQITAAAAVTVLIILRPNPYTDEDRPAVPVRRTFAILAVFGMSLFGAIVPLLVWVGALNIGDRGDFWRLAIDGIEESPLIGQGGTGWPSLYQTGDIPIAGTYSPHNQWLDVMYASGLLGLVLFVGLLAYLVLRTTRFSSAAACILIPVLAASTLERPWSFAINDGLTFTLLACLLCVKSVSRPRRKKRTSTPRAAAWPHGGAHVETS